MIYFGLVRFQFWAKAIVQAPARARFCADQFYMLFRTNDLLHSGQLYFLTPLWKREWVFKWPFKTNDLLHSGQLYFLTPPWIRLWWKRLLLLANVFGHTSQDNCSGIFKDHLLSSEDLCANWRKSWIYELHEHIAFPFTNIRLLDI